MKKLLITLLCVFLVLVLISLVAFPNSDLEDTVIGIKALTKPLFIALNWLSDVGRGLLYDNNQGLLDSASSAEEAYYIMLSTYIPHYLDLSDQRDRAANQGVSMYTSLYDFHEHKICVIPCFNAFDANLISGDSFGLSFNVYYCAVCDKVLYISANVNNEGATTMQRYREFYGIDGITYSDIEDKWWKPWFLNGFNYSDMKEYINSLK